MPLSPDIFDFQHPFRRAFVLGLAFVLFALFRWGSPLIGFNRDWVEAMGALEMIVAVPIAYGIYDLILRLLFGPQPPGEWTTSLKIITAIGVVAAISLAILVGDKQYGAAHPIASQPILPVYHLTPEAQRGLEVMQEYQAKRNAAATTKPVKPATRKSF